ncbi:hypothetical protein QBC46DRAFT_356722 [Diplogelasinospora grovesii]|uniref:Uncharacterized protein n=1 Tax=Diplogelasinospora grovesii TaxID=303347 RepID=A0AAN6S2F4_9PEZI|nr:hypothetical protein QBC46DRAFT_356722 [Diplogelasinospora grovesii]
MDSNASSLDPVTEYLIEENLPDEFGRVPVFPPIVLDLFAACREGRDGMAAAALEAARRIHRYYHEEFVPSDPLERCWNLGMNEFLPSLYGMIFETARLISYDDEHDRQEALVQVLVELRKLPEVTFRRSYNCEKEIAFVNDQWFAYVERELKRIYFVHYRDFRIDDYESSSSSGDPKDLKTSCNEWVSISAFLARCLRAGICDNDKRRCLKPWIDIRFALEEDTGNLPEAVRNSLRIIAAQYILLYGRPIYNHMASQITATETAKKWSLWAAKLKELLQEGRGNGIDEKLASVLKRTLAEVESIASDVAA